VRARRGSLTDLRHTGISGTRKPGNNTPDSTDDEPSPVGGQRGAHNNRSAHNNRREHGAANLKAHCWCQKETLNVPAVLIRRAETLSCGHPECTKEH